MLIQVGLAFVTLVASGLMLARYARVGGAVNILGSMATFILGIFYTRSLELAARSGNLRVLRLEYTRFYAVNLNIPVDRLVATLLIVPVFPLAMFLLASGLGGLAASRR